MDRANETQWRNEKGDRLGSMIALLQWLHGGIHVEVIGQTSGMSVLRAISALSKSFDANGADHVVSTRRII